MNPEFYYFLLLIPKQKPTKLIANQ